MNEIYIPGISDDMFERGDVPITKEEIRTIVISKLRLSVNSKILDIGAGTGSVTVECALMAKDGMVHAFEKNEEALGLIRKNIEKFGAGNVVIVAGEAPAALENAGNFDRAFIGGSGGNILDILDFVYKKIAKRGRIVVTAVTLDTLCKVMNFFKSMKCSHEIIQVSVTRVSDAGGLSMLKALNPVFIISAERTEL